MCKLLIYTYTLTMICFTNMIINKQCKILKMRILHIYLPLCNKLIAQWGGYCAICMYFLKLIVKLLVYVIYVK